MERAITVNVNESPFNAVGDGKTDDRAAIQQAVDFCCRQGGGTVVLKSGYTYLTSGVVLRTGVTLFLEEFAILHQTNDQGSYVKPVGDGYEPYTPIPGHNYSDTIKWSHCWYKNYPFIFAPQGSHSFAVKGKGTVRMADCDDPEKLIRICPIGFYGCSDFEISDIHITNYHCYALMLCKSEQGLVKGIRVNNWSMGNADGICLMNCRNMHITGCDLFTGDDSLYIFSSYRDPRKSEWWNSDSPVASENIEIDNNNLVSNHCKALAIIPWGIDCPDLERVEVRNVYVHHNRIETLGVWLYNPYTDKIGAHPPITDLRFEDNTIDGIEANFFETQVSDLRGFRSMSDVHNGDFRDGRCFWVLKGNGSKASVGVELHPEDSCSPYGYIGDFHKGEARLYQGVYLESGKVLGVQARVLAEGEPCLLTVRSQKTDELIASLPFDSRNFETLMLTFTVPESGNYLLGIESGEAKSGRAKISEMKLASYPSAQGYKDVLFDDGKLIFRYTDKLFDRNLYTSQLKMYWLKDSEVTEPELPEGYSFSHYKGPEDFHDWCECIRTGEPLSPQEEAAQFKREIFDFKYIVPERDLWFLDYKGQHVGTATTYIDLETGIGDVHWVGIRSEFRGKGLSKYLTMRVMKTLKEQDCRFVSLTTRENRPYAVRAYLKAGFLPVEYAEGMEKRWLKVMETNGIAQLPLLDENGKLLKVLRV